MKVYRTTILILAAAFTLSAAALAQPGYPFNNRALPMQARVNDLLSRLTVEEKISLMGFNSKGIERLGIPAYNWWNEALHGVARAGLATVYPQAIGMAATFNDSLLKVVADAISTEARAKYNIAVANNNRVQYLGLSFWSPNINIFRDPRWGRGQETYGEDPFLTAAMGLAFVKGMQGSDKRYLKTAAGAKHFAVHSGPEAGRHSFNAVVDEKDLRETYLYAFKKLVDGGVETVMCAYNRLNNDPCCTSNTLLANILRKEWGFKGHVVTDCGALYDIIDYHKLTDDKAKVAADALKAGVNLDCADLLQTQLLNAYERKLVTKAEIDSSLAVLLRTQFRLGFYDDRKAVPFSGLGSESVHSARNVELARTAAQQSMVLLKNERNLLPLDKKRYGSIMVLGANAGAMDPMVANYHGMSGNIVTFAEGITAAAGPGIAVQYDQGSDYRDTTRFGGIWAAGESDITVAVIGLTPVYEGEEGDAFLAEHGGDKLSLNLPAAHIAMLRALRKKNKPVVVVVTAGSDVDIAAIAPYADAIILAWYPGEQGGNALADLLFGKISPGGRLPVTFYRSLNDLPAYDNYNMQGRTYRYFHGPVQFPFGFGLSYTSFGYAWKQKPAVVNKGSESIQFSIEISNVGAMDGDEVAQVYVQYPPAGRMPIKELRSFKRVSIKKGGKRLIQFSIPLGELQKWDLAKNGWTLHAGEYRILVGASSADIKLEEAITIKP